MEVEIRIKRLRLLQILLIVPTLAACMSKTPLPSLPAQTAAALSTPPEATVGGTSGQLTSRWTASPPAMDGQIEDLWSLAEPLHVPLTRGPGSTERALDVVLRSLYTDDTVAFLAQWPGERPASAEGTLFNEFTLHWRIPDQAAQGLNCTVVCHTAFADGSGRFVYANAETIPQGGDEALAAAGGWDAGTWTLEWSRPLVSSNPFDLQFDDRAVSAPFRVKIFERVEGRPDPVSEPYSLVFLP